MENTLYEISTLQRGLLEKLIKRGKPIEKEVILELLPSLKITPIKKNLPSVFRTDVTGGMEDFKQILPLSLCRHLFNPIHKIKLEY